MLYNVNVHVITIRLILVCNFTIVEFIQDWVTSGPIMTIQWYTVKLDPKCPVSISSLGAQECGKESSYLDDPTISRCVDVCIARSSP